MSVYTAYNAHVTRTTAAGVKPLTLRKFADMVWAIIVQSTK